MKTIVLPGFAPNNRQWAQEVQSRLGSDAVIHEWNHWAAGDIEIKDFPVRDELAGILNDIGDDTVNVIGKSIGALMAAQVLRAIGAQRVHKMILCGISVSPDFVFDSLGKMQPENILCFQNDRDPFLSFQKAKLFLQATHPKIKIVQGMRSDHEYPYFDEFKEFLGS